MVLLFKDDTNCEKVNYAKFETFDVGGSQSIMNEDHDVFRVFNTLQAPVIYGQPTLAGARAHAHARVRVRARRRAPSRLPGARPCPRALARSPARRPGCSAG